MNLISKFLNFEKFLNIETPILTKNFSEGSKSFIIPCENKKNIFFSLVQSPQLFKQILVLSGVLRYYQFSKCFRNENFRKDRNNEFIQFDLEFSSFNNLNILFFLESLIIFILNVIFIKFNYYKFSLIHYKNCIKIFLNDKPDLRNKINLNLNNFYFLNLNYFNKYYSYNYLNLIFFFGFNFKNYIFFIKNKINFNYIYIYNNKFIFKNFILKFSLKIIIFELILKMKFHKNLIQIYLKKININLEYFNKLSKSNFDNNFFNFNLNFLWILNFPLFKYSLITKKFNYCGNPFSKILNFDILYLDLNPIKCLSKSYDLIINKLEIVSGSSRNEKKFLQKKIFLITTNFYECLYNFNFFLNFYKLGSTPCGGFGLGLDRLICILIGNNNIKSSLIFYKNMVFNKNLKSPNFIF